MFPLHRHDLYQSPKTPDRTSQLAFSNLFNIKLQDSTCLVPPSLQVWELDPRDMFLGSRPAWGLGSCSFGHARWSPKCHDDWFSKARWTMSASERKTSLQACCLGSVRCGHLHRWPVASEVKGLVWAGLVFFWAPGQTGGS